MKKILLSVTALTFLLGTVNAQEANVGIKMGLGWSEWYGTDIDKMGTTNQTMYMGKISGYSALADAMAKGTLTDGLTEEVFVVDKVPGNRMSFHAGFQINSELSDYFWLKHEFLFATKGFGYTGDLQKVTSSVTSTDTSLIFDATTTKVDMRYRSYHVDILPVSLAGHYEGLQLFVGPYVSVMLASNWVDKTNAKVTTPGVDDFAYVTDDTDPANVYRALNIIDYGFVGGFEYELPFGLHAGIRYMQGFGSVLETPEGESRTNAFNKDLRISLGYTFGKE